MSLLILETPEASYVGIRPKPLVGLGRIKYIEKADGRLTLLIHYANSG